MLRSVHRYVLWSTLCGSGYYPAEKIGLKPNKEDVGQTLGAYGMGPGCYFVLPILGPTTARDSIGLIADSFVDPFAQITIHEKSLIGISGNNIDYFSVKGTSAVDFRSDNITNFDSLEKNSLDNPEKVSNKALTRCQQVWQLLSVLAAQGEGDKGGSICII